MKFFPIGVKHKDEVQSHHVFRLLCQLVAKFGPIGSSCCDAPASFHDAQRRVGTLRSYHQGCPVDCNVWITYFSSSGKVTLQGKTPAKRRAHPMYKEMIDPLP